MNSCSSNSRSYCSLASLFREIEGLLWRYFGEFFAKFGFFIRFREVGTNALRVHLSICQCTIDLYNYVASSTSLAASILAYWPPQFWLIVLLWWAAVRGPRSIYITSLTYWLPHKVVTSEWTNQLLQPIPAVTHDLDTDITRFPGCTIKWWSSSHWIKLYPIACCPLMSDN